MASIEHLYAQEKAELFGLLTELGIPYESEYAKFLIETIPNIIVREKSVEVSFAQAYRRMIERFSDGQTIPISNEIVSHPPIGSRLRIPDKLTITGHLHKDINDESHAFAKWERFTGGNARTRKEYTRYRLTYWGENPNGSRAKRVRLIPKEFPLNIIVKNWTAETLLGRKGINVNKVEKLFDDEKWEKK